MYKNFFRKFKGFLPKGITPPLMLLLPRPADKGDDPESEDVEPEVDAYSVNKNKIYLSSYIVQYKRIKHDSL